MRARNSIVILATAALVVLGVLWLGGSDDGIEVQAEFADARGLREGNEVRVQGAPAGTVEKIELTDSGTALVTFRLHEGLEAPRSDAVAAIRPVDLLGDIFLSFSPGTSDEPLEGRLSLEQTVNRPRIDDLLRTFDEPVRTGLQALFVELGLSLERRGEDLNRAIAELSPALEATDELMTELGSQNAALRRLVEDAHRATGQVARRDRDLRTLISDFAAILTTTADHSAALDRDLAAMPAALGQLRSTSASLERAASTAMPLARNLGEAAPSLALTASRLPHFLDEAEITVGDVRPLVRRLTSLLELSDPALADLASGGDRLRAAAPEISDLMDAVVPAAPPISEGFFVNFADQGEESGTQPFDPNGDPARKYWRGAGVFTCESFGVKVEPNCLGNFLAGRRARAARRAEPVLDYLLGR